MNPRELRDTIESAASRLGFHRVGITPAEPPPRYSRYREWLHRGYAAGMSYMATPENVEARRDPRSLVAEARSVVVVASAYPKPAGSNTDAGWSVSGVVAGYARGRDYHDVMKQRLHTLADEVSEAVGSPVAARACVDSAPVLERGFAERAGLGFVGKNTMLIIPGIGSYVLLGELLIAAEAAPTAPARGRESCGSCRACLDACPTGAFASDYVLDARACISYLTIEHRGPIPAPLRPAIGTRVFGCDACQDACPYNAAAPNRCTPDLELAPLDAERGAPDLLALLALGANQRKRYIAGTALRRVNREQLVRNLCVALGNAGDARAIPALTDTLDDPSAVVRGHAAWALGRLGARDPLSRALARETDPDAMREISAALTSLPR